MRRLAIIPAACAPRLAAGALILAACLFAAGNVHAEADSDRQRSAWPQDEDKDKPSTPLSEWLPSVLPGTSSTPPQAETAKPAAPAPAESAPDPEPRHQPTSIIAPPKPAPAPLLSRKEQEAQSRWWKDTGDQAVAAFSRCLAHHVVAQIESGSTSSYPDFVTSAMHGPCSREFARMAQLILDRYGEDNFARVARKLIATKFVPTVKQVAEGGALPEELQPKDDRAVLAADMRRSKEAMLSCMVREADQLAMHSTAALDRIADSVIAACRGAARAYVDNLEQLYPGAAGGTGDAAVADILDGTYRPVIIQRVATRRDGPARGAVAGSVGTSGSGKAGRKAGRDTGRHGNGEWDGAAGGDVAAAGHDGMISGKADAESAGLRRPRSVIPTDEPAPMSPVPASSRP